MKTNNYKTPHIAYQNVISFTCSDGSINSLIEFLNKLRSLGQMGSSRDVTIDWDGDGRDRVENISVNGMSLDAWDKEQKRLKNNIIDVKNDDIIDESNETTQEK